MKEIKIPIRENKTHEWKDYDDKSGGLYIDGMPVAKYDLTTGEVMIGDSWYKNRDWRYVSVLKIHEFIEEHIDKEEKI